MAPGDDAAGSGAAAMRLRQRHSAWRVARAFLFLFNVHTLAVCALTCAFTWLCAERGWGYDVDSQLFVIGINFPLTFALTQAFTRRERALTYLAEMKASAVGLFFAYRDWPQVFPPPPPPPPCFSEAALRGDAGAGARGLGAPAAPRPAAAAASWPHTLGDNENPWAREARVVLVDFLAAVKDYLSVPCGFESIGEARLVAHEGHGQYLRELLFGGPSTTFASGGRGSRARRQRLLERPTASFVDRVRRVAQEHPGHGALVRAYGALSRLHVLNEHLSQAARYGRGGEGSISRCAQYVRFCSAQWEQLRVVKDYRTPFFLRWCCFLLVHIGCFALAPSFVRRGSCDTRSPGGGHSGHGDAGDAALYGPGEAHCPGVYINAVMYVVISLLLLNVQASAEHPFDAESVDDLFFELPDELWEIATMPRWEGGGGGGGSGPGSGSPDGCFEGEGGAALFAPARAEARAAEAEMTSMAAAEAAAGAGGRRRDE